MVKEIEALSRGLTIFAQLERQGPIGLSALARASGLPKASLLRVLTTLQSAGYARQRLADQRWQATARVAGGPANQHRRLAAIAGPVLDDLCHRVLWPSDVGIYDNGVIRVLETSRRLSPFLVNRDVISSNIHVLPSAMGRAILAWSSPEAQARILAVLAKATDAHDRAARDRDRIMALIAETRARGYAIRHTGYFISAPREAQVTAVAVPVIQDDTAVASINLSWVASAMVEAEFVSRHLAELRNAADRIAHGLARAA